MPTRSRGGDGTSFSPKGAVDRIVDPRLRAFLRYWLELRGDRLVPDRRDFDPAEVAPILRYFWICAKEPKTGRFRFRLAGEELLFATPRGHFDRIAGGDLANRPANSPGGAFGTGTYLLGVALKRAIDDGDRAALAPAATFSDGLAQQRVLDAARRSHGAGGRWQTV